MALLIKTHKENTHPHYLATHGWRLEYRTKHITWRRDMKRDWLLYRDLRVVGGVQCGGHEGGGFKNCLLERSFSIWCEDALYEFFALVLRDKVESGGVIDWWRCCACWSWWCSLEVLEWGCYGGLIEWDTRVAEAGVVAASWELAVRSEGGKFLGQTVWWWARLDLPR